MHRVINIMKIVRLFSFIILIGAYLSADSNSGNLPAPIPIDFGVNYGMRSDSTFCDSCNTTYNLANPCIHHLSDSEAHRAKYKELRKKQLESLNQEEEKKSSQTLILNKEVV